jgi:predicted helicase
LGQGNRHARVSAKTKIGLGFQNADRVKLIMACGTGKTFTSLKIAEEIAGKNKLVLFLVPSLNLLSQSLTEWTQESGLLHFPDYRSRYADNLGKELPRIPAVKRFADFQAFSKAGRDLAHWHLNYETVACYKGVKIEGDAGTPARKGGSELRAGVPASLYRVEKMKFAKTRDPETNKSINDKTTVLYNAHVTIRDIPVEAYAYVFNGLPELELA